MLSKIQIFTDKFSKNAVISAVSDGLVSTLPITMIGSISSLLSNLPITGYQSFITNHGIKDVLSIPVQLSVNILSIYVVFFIAYHYANKQNIDGITAGILALMGFLFVTPISQIKIDDVTTNYLSFDWLGAKGLFVAILMALMSAKIFVFLIKRNIIVKMPEGVPQAISKTFSSLIPGFVIAIISLLIVLIMRNTGYENIHQMVYSFVQVPLEHIGSNYFAFIIAITLCQVLWFFGIHGTMVIYSVMNPIWMALDAQNLAAYSAGTALPNLAGKQFFNLYSGIGGSGGTLALCLLFTFFARSKRYKMLGKIALPASCFSINEPVIFGTPLVMNPKLVIPFIGVPFVSITLGYVCTSLGIVPPANGAVLGPGFPPFITGLMEGSWKIAALQFVLLIISLIMYYPFFRIVDREAYEEENQETAKAVE